MRPPLRIVVSALLSMLVTSLLVTSLLASSAFASEEPAPGSLVEDPPLKRIQVGAAFLPMLSGRITTSPSAGDATSNLDTAYGICISANYLLLAGLSVGLAPQVIIHLTSKDSAGYSVIDSEKEYDLLARIAYAYAVSPKVDVYAELSPGYSFVTYHQIILGSRAPNGRGVVLGGGLGAAYAVSDQAFVNLGLGYQAGFQVSHGISNRDVSTRFLRVALGGGVRF